MTIKLLLSSLIFVSAAAFGAKDGEVTADRRIPVGNSMTLIGPRLYTATYGDAVIYPSDESALGACKAYGNYVAARISNSSTGNANWVASFTVDGDLAGFDPVNGSVNKIDTLVCFKTKPNKPELSSEIIQSMSAACNAAFSSESSTQSCIGAAKALYARYELDEIRAAISQCDHDFSSESEELSCMGQY